MRDVDPSLQSSLEMAPIDGLVPRRLVYFTGTSFSTGDPTSLAVWSGDDVMSFNVESPTDDTNLSRSYRGGVNLATSSIALVSDLTIQSVSISMSAISPHVENFIRGSDLRLGKVQIHDLILSSTSRNPVSVAPLVFLGEIDGSPIETEGRGGDLSVTIRAVSDVISMLTRTNPAKSSYQEQLLRGGDEFGLYSSTVDTWRVLWGRDD